MFSLSELHNEHESAYGALWQITIGSIVCMCCVMFLGLKFKWFRAQLKLGDAPNNHVETVPVQGVGFRFKSNPDDFQLYTVRSELVAVSKQKQQNKNSNYSTSMIASNKQVSQSSNSKTQVQAMPVSQSQSPNKSTSQISSKPISQSSKVLNQVTPKPAPQTSNSKINKTEVTSTPSSQSLNSNNSTNMNQVLSKPQSTNLNIYTDEPVKISKEQPSSILKKEDSSETKKTVIFEEEYVEMSNVTKPNKIVKKDWGDKQKSINFEEDYIEITNPSAQKYSELINKPLQQNTSTTIDDEYEIMQVNAKKQVSSPVRNPLAAKNVMATEKEDNWKIQIVDEKPKDKSAKQENSENMYFTATNSNMFSSQAASIFFAEKIPEPQPRARKFMEMDEDNVSSNSQTSA